MIAEEEGQVSESDDMFNTSQKSSNTQKTLISDEPNKCRGFPKPSSPIQTYKRVDHKLKYSLPILHNPLYEKRSPKERSQQLFEYYSQMNELTMNYYRKHGGQPTFSKIIPITTSKISLGKQESPMQFFGVERKGVYQSRSGRQCTKRNYSEVEFDFDTNSNEARTEDDNIKITMPNLVVEEKDKESTPIKGNHMPKKFKELPIEKKSEEDDFEIYMSVIDDIDVNKDEDESVDFVPGRISPKIPKKVLKQTKKPVVRKPSTSTTKAPSKKRAPKKKFVELPEVEVVETMPCPLCEKQFPKDKIEAHAANCGIEVEAVLVPVSPELTALKMKCQICSRFVDSSGENYESHVRDCMAENIVAM